MLKSTPPATATSISPADNAWHADMIAAREDPPAASTVKPPPRKPNWAQMVVAIVAAALPASVCSVTGGNGAR